jgi:SecD/SecF fusion protein
VTASTPSASAIIQNLDAHGMKGSNVQYATSGNQKLIYVTVPPNASIPKNDDAAARAMIAQSASIDPSTGSSFTSIGPTIQGETIRNAILGVILSSALIVLYLGIRFGMGLGGFKIGLRFAVSTILALGHDILVVIGLAAIMGYTLGWELSALFISAMLTVIGFSTHDTIVIFDRIRENLRKNNRGDDIGDLINRSITQSLARSINTSATVVVTLALLIAMGSATPDLKLFNLAMLVGIVSGTYSSIFNASPILYLWDKSIERRKGKEHTILGIANQTLTTSRVAVPLSEVAPAAATATTPSGQSYGQVKRRRASDVQRSTRAIDDDI